VVEIIEVKSLLNITDFPWAECAIVENRNLYVSDSLSLKRSKRGTGIHRYELELVTVEMDLAEGRGIKAKLSAAVDDVLIYVHPRLGFCRGTEPAAGIKVAGTGNSQGSKTVALSSTQPWQLLAGDYIQFSNDTKLYECADDTLLVVGIQSVKLNTPIRYPLTDNASVTVNNVAFYLESDGLIEVGMEASDNQDMQQTLIAVEKL
jgi:hypothetical protein